MAEKWWNNQYDNMLVDVPKTVLKQIHKSVEKLVKSGQIRSTNEISPRVEEIINQKIQKHNDLKQKIRAINKKENLESDIKTIEGELSGLEKQFNDLTEQKRALLDQIEKTRAMNDNLARDKRALEQTRARMERAINIEVANIDNCKIVYRKIIERHKEIVREEINKQLRDEVENKYKAEMSKARAQIAEYENARINWDIEAVKLKGELHDSKEYIEELKARISEAEGKLARLSEIESKLARISEAEIKKMSGPPKDFGRDVGQHRDVGPKPTIVPIMPRKAPSRMVGPIEHDHRDDFLQELIKKAQDACGAYKKNRGRAEFVDLIRKKISVDIVRNKISGLTLEQLEDVIYQQAGEITPAPPDIIGAIDLCKKEIKPAEFDIYYF